MINTKDLFVCEDCDCVWELLENPDDPGSRMAECDECGHIHAMPTLPPDCPEQLVETTNLKYSQ